MKANYIPLYVVDDKFVRISENLKGNTTFKLSLVKDINKATRFRDEKSAKSWDSYIVKTYPKAKLKKAGLILLNDIKEHNRNINTVIKSCEEGRDGDWDVSTDEGKEGFDDMITLLERCLIK